MDGLGCYTHRIVLISEDRRLENGMLMSEIDAQHRNLHVGNVFFEIFLIYFLVIMFPC